MRLLDGVDHLILLTLRGRSFDHLLGALRLEGREDIDGLRGEEVCPLDGVEHRVFALDDGGHISADGPVSCPTPRPPDARPYAWTQLQGAVPAWHPRADWSHAQPYAGAATPCSGFARAYALAHPEADPRLPLGYFTRRSAPTLYALADRFTVCTRWFASAPASGLTNRLFAVCGEAGPEAESADPPSRRRTMVELLDRAGVSWGVYGDGGSLSQLLGGARSTAPIAALLRALRGDAPLPSVSVVEPDCRLPHDLQLEERLVYELVEALTSGPRWARSLLVITYDGPGGWYDHVPPPETGEAPPFERLGGRVPALLVSPWAVPGVCGLTLDHRALVQGALARFASAYALSPQPRDEGVAAFGEVEGLDTPRLDPPRLPAPPPAFDVVVKALAGRAQGLGEPPVWAREAARLARPEARPDPKLPPPPRWPRPEEEVERAIEDRLGRFERAAEALSSRAERAVRKLDGR